MHPHRIGPYLIDKKIGAGGMGTVYRGRHTETGQIAAIKVLPASLARQEGFVARFNREIKAMKTVSSPFIVKFFDDPPDDSADNTNSNPKNNGKQDDTQFKELGENEGDTQADDAAEADDKTYFYAMEYVEGETLTNLLRREKRLTWEKSIEFAIHIATALKAAHNSGVFHRDLKPSNLMVSTENVVKLTDFGVAHVFASTRLTRTGGIVGTAEYMSPEQAQGKKAGKRSDLYSLGAVMYAMLTGRPPFTGKTSMDVVHKLQYVNFDMPSRYVPGIPATLEKTVCKLLEKNPDDRYQDALQVIRELESIQKREESRRVHDVTLDGGRTVGNTPATVAVGDLPEPSGPGSATVVRNFVVEQFERKKRGTFVSRLLDNTAVLCGLLAIIVIGGIYFVRPSNEMSAAARFERGVELMETPGDQWSIAGSEYFKPLLADEEWAPKVRPYLRKIEQYEASEKIRRQSDRILVSRTEPERLLLQAKHLAEVGDTVQARRKLESIVKLLADADEFSPMVSVAKRMIKKLDEAAAESDAVNVFLAQRMQKARTLQADGQVDEAIRIWRSIVDLYGSDDDAREITDECNKLLSETPATAVKAENDAAVEAGTAEASPAETQEADPQDTAPTTKE